MTNSRDPFNTDVCGDSNLPADAVVDQLLGDAYRVVKYVAMRMPQIQTVFDNISHITAIWEALDVLKNLELHIPDLQVIQAKLTELMAIHANLAELLNINDNMDALLAVNANMDKIDIIIANLAAINNVSTNISSITVVSDNIAAVADVAANIQALLDIHAKLPQLQVLHDQLQIAIDALADLADTTDTTKGVSLVGGANRNVKTVAHMHALASAKNPFVVLHGYHIIGDKRPTMYYLDPQDSTSVDDGFSVIVTADGGRYHLNHNGNVFIEDGGAVGDGRDSTVRIQACIDFCSPRRIQLHAGPGTFGLNLDRTAPVEGYALARCALLSRDGFSLHGSGMGVTIFRVLNGETNRITATLPWFNVIAHNTIGRNVEMTNLTIDINGQNNPISRPGDEMPGYNTAGFMVSGSVATVGVDARLTDSRFFRVGFINNPGVTSIGLGHRYSHPGITGNNVTIEQCKFYNSGIDSKDHSSIYAHCDGVSILNNEFDHPTASTGLRGPIVAAELHGSNCRMLNNNIRNYMQGFWIVAGEEGGRSGLIVSGNTMHVNWWGGGIWTNSLWNNALGDILIFNNIIRLNGNPIANPAVTGSKYGIYIAVGDGTNALRIKVYDNILYCTDRTDNAGIYVGSNLTSTTGDVLVTGNQISGHSHGIIIGLSAGGITNVAVRGNQISNCAPTTAHPTTTYGILLADAIRMFSLDISDNNISSGDVGVAPVVGVAVRGPVVNLFMDGNNTTDCPVGINDTAVVSGRRRGRQATTFSGPPTQGTWKIGDIAYMHPAPLQGPAGSTYIMDGWQRMTDGNSHVFNVDWKERRLPTM
ncbi:hypothetical protein JJJA_0079 [Achromobacter phage JWDelta]|uniref:Right handed beta helix domain-containing protein n=1 Tax=Achromobacter phage JWDelta TaxID=1416008 RepID=V9SKC4_9CAUD|nr:hypothetical protein JJJA_0079 [Achromobacter phage JWDelta]